MNGRVFVRLGAEQAEQAFGLGHEDLLQQLVLEQRSAGEHEAVLEQVREVGGVVHVVGQADEVAAELPADGLAQQLLAAAGELAVDRRPRDARLLHDVFDRRLGQPEPRHAGVGGGQQPLPYAERVARLGLGRLTPPF